MAKKDEGKKYVEGLLALIPEDKRAAVSEALQLEPVLEHVGEHVMLRSDYSRAQDQLKQNADAVLGYKGQLDTWYSTVNQELVRGTEALRRLEALKTTDEPTATPAPTAPAGLTPEQVEKLLQDRIGQTEQQTLGLVSYVTTLAQHHYARYGEVLDTGKLIAEARRQNKRLPELYEEQTREQREKLEAKQTKEAEDKLREKIRAEITTEIREKGGHGAYPLPGADADPQGNVTLAGLKTTKEGGGQEYGVKAALDSFYAKGQNIGT